MQTNNVRVERWVLDHSKLSLTGECFAGAFYVSEQDAESEAIRFLRQTSKASRVVIGRDRVVYVNVRSRQQFLNGNGTSTMIQPDQIARIEGQNETYRVTAIA